MCIWCRPLQKLHKIKNSEHLNSKVSFKLKDTSHTIFEYSRKFQNAEYSRIWMCIWNGPLENLNSEIFNMLFYSFQNILKFQHAFLQFSEHAENFNMLFYSFQHSFSICFQHALQISTCSEIFNTLSNMKI